MENERAAHREFLMEAKVPGGKLARLRIGEDGRVRLSGDFFIYPEEGISIIEETLCGLHGDESPEAIASALEAAVDANGLQLVGLDVPVIAQLFKGAANVESPGP